MTSRRLNTIKNFQADTGLDFNEFKWCVFDSLSSEYPKPFSEAIDEIYSTFLARGKKRPSVFVRVNPVYSEICLTAGGEPVASSDKRAFYAYLETLKFKEGARYGFDCQGRVLPFENPGAIYECICAESCSAGRPLNTLTFYKLPEKGKVKLFESFGSSYFYLFHDGAALFFMDNYDEPTPDDLEFMFYDKLYDEQPAESFYGRSEDSISENAAGFIPKKYINILKRNGI